MFCSEERTTKTKKITNCKEGRRSFFVVLNSSNFWLRRTGVMPFHISPGLDEWYNNHVKVLYVNYFSNLRLKELRGYLPGALYQFTSDCKAPSRLKGFLFPIYPSFLMRKNILVSLTVRVEASIHKGKIPLQNLCKWKIRRLLFCFAMIRQDSLSMEIIAWLRF